MGARSPAARVIAPTGSQVSANLWKRCGLGLTPPNLSMQQLPRIACRLMAALEREDPAASHDLGQM